MMISEVTTDHYRIPLPVTLSDSTHGEMSAFDLVAVRIRDGDGAEGVGYTYTAGTSAAVIRTIIEDFKPLLEGEAADRIERHWQRMWWSLHYSGRGGHAVFAISAVDIALWDLAARRAGVPLWRLLGGHDPEVRAYAGGIDLQFPLSQLLDQTRDNLERGFRAIKMKVGRDRLSEDVARVAAMRDLLGPDTPLMVDANMRWTPDEAIRASRAMAESQVYWLEEPTIPDDFEGHGRIMRDGALPIAAGENLRTLYEFQHLIAAGGVSFPEPDVSNCGGITTWMKIAHLAEANNLPVTSHGVHDLHVHLLAAVPNKSFLEVHGFGLERYIAQPLEIVDGLATAPDRPGHGVAFDWDGLAAFRQ
ncbi:MAG: mandelate racemase/muconate lactonizing enzyme family protein [Alphaproteobacteria bacterium]|jgi:L-alanine-DL-glutamate epimerase-like enolase superfamily enzyme|nr:mandelate racemase/muconate lactonizing enzyme family protein [Alphaproteobacteria bacterium]